MGDFTPDGLDSRSLETLWEWKNRVLLEEDYIFNVVIPLEYSTSFVLHSPVLVLVLMLVLVLVLVLRGPS